MTLAANAVFYQKETRGSEWRSDVVVVKYWLLHEGKSVGAFVILEKAVVRAYS